MKKSLILYFLIGIAISGNAQNPLVEYYEDINKPFSAISKEYTLILTAVIDDCGEFGGHKETIELKKKDEKFIAELIIYEQHCDGTWQVDKMKKINSKISPVTDDFLKEIEEYLAKLIEMSLKEEIAHHAGSYFYADLQWRNKSDYKGQRINLNFHDSLNEWEEFKKLKTRFK